MMSYMPYIRASHIATTFENQQSILRVFFGNITENDILGISFLGFGNSHVLRFPLHIRIYRTQSKWR